VHKPKQLPREEFKLVAEEMPSTNRETPMWDMHNFKASKNKLMVSAYRLASPRNGGCWETEI